MSYFSLIEKSNKDNNKNKLFNYSIIIIFKYNNKEVQIENKSKRLISLIGV